MLGSPVPRVSNGIQRIPVDDRRWVTIRPVEEGDSDDLLHFYQRLSPAARFARFMSMGTDGLAVAADRFAHAGRRASVGFVAELREAGPDDGAIVGHLCMEPTDSGAQEIGLAVADEFRGRGIGTALMRQAVASARCRHIGRLTADMFGTNQPMRRIMLDAGGQLLSDHLDAGVESIEVRIDELSDDRGRVPREDPGLADALDRRLRCA
jgi:RimJ/RimL family protein N-acetyltransferase